VSFLAFIGFEMELLWRQMQNDNSLNWMISHC